MSRPSVARATILSFVAVLILGLLAGCGAGEQKGEEQAFIKATPNPVPAGGGPQGTTTISWNTGGGGSQGQIYVSEDGAPEKLFAEGKQGSAKAPWIATGKKYRFSLYAGTKRAKLLDKVEVTRSVVERTTENTTSAQDN